jgi:predicted nucleic acid-binding protein
VPLVLDASIVGCWFFRDEQDPRAEAAWNKLREDRAVVPLHWWFEVRNVCLLGERRGRATEVETDEFLRELPKLTISFDSLPDQVALIGLARRHRLTLYDAAYLELAQREGIPLATLDKELVTAARAEGVSLVLAAP